jgi:MFS family permease
MSSKTLSNYEHGIHARNAVWASFFALGITGMAWVPRIPEIKSQLGLSDGQFGLLLIASTIGAIPGAQLSGRIVHMFSSKIVVRIAGVTLPLGVSIMGIAENVPTLAVGLFFCGFSVSFMDVALNSQAIAIEEHTQGRWMSTFHGLWSIGAFFAALIGGLIANFVSPKVNLLAMSALCFISYFFITHYLLPPDLDGHRGKEGTETSSKVPLVGKEAMILWGLGIGLICAMIPEGGAYDWSGILLQDHMDIGKGANAAAAVVSLYREELARNHAFAAATSAMAQALLVSIGPDNKIFLEAHSNPDPLYSLSPRQIVDAMLLEHGTTSADDLKKLRAPLYEPLKALADLERPMNAFL